MYTSDSCSLLSAAQLCDHENDSPFAVTAAVAGYPAGTIRRLSAITLHGAHATYMCLQSFQPSDATGRTMTVLLPAFLGSSSHGIGFLLVVVP